MAWDGDFGRGLGRTRSLLQTKDCLSHLRTMGLRREGINLDKWRDLFLLKEVRTLMVGSLRFSLKELEHEIIYSTAC